MSRRPLSIFRLVGPRSKVKPILNKLGKGALVFHKQLYFILYFVSFDTLLAGRLVRMDIFPVIPEPLSSSSLRPYVRHKNDLPLYIGQIFTQPLIQYS